MRFCFRSVLFIACFLLAGKSALHAQDRPIGYWRSHLPYNRTIGVASDGVTLYAISEQALFTYNAKIDEVTAYSKVDGMADVGMSQVAYDAATNTVVLGYANSNIDLFKDNSFHNMPDIKIKIFTGSKTINNIFTDRGMAYVSTSLGLVVLNLEKKEVKETYVFSKNNQTISFNAFTADNAYFYAATSKGLYRARRNAANLQLFSSWLPLDSSQYFVSLATVNEKVFAAGVDSLYVVNGNALQFLTQTDSSIVRLDAGKDVLQLSLHGRQSKVKRMNMNYQVTDSFDFGDARQTTVLSDGTLWVAEYNDGLTEADGGNRRHIRPAGPYSYATFDILANNGDLWIAHGGHKDNWALTYNYEGISNFKNGTWTNYRSENTPAMNGMYDIIDLSRDGAGNIYGGSIQEGIAVIKPDGTVSRIRDGQLEAKDREPNTIPATSTETDQGGNLWVTQLGAKNELAVRTTDGNWYHYPTSPNLGGYAYSSAGLIIDDNNQKWYYGLTGKSVIVYNDNNTPENGADDQFRQYKKGVGYGNLPSDRIFCLAKDRDGAIWVGTDDGIAIINCAAYALQNNCDAELRIVRYDQFSNYLFKEQQVKAIAVDGGNRKWVGTNNGVWLISPDANKIIQRFTKDNSPLPSDVIQTIGIDPVTGDVYIGTDQGLVSYRGTSTEGSTTNTNVVTFPNPVPSGYGGTIAIRGLVTDADVRITDVAGQLIYRTKAQGGQATWSGLDYTGHRPQSGVYLIFITNKDGSQTHVGKMMFYN